jgi:flagellar motor switch protein FliG
MDDGTRKAAALLIAMGRPMAQRMVARFDEAELRALSQSARNLPPMNRAVVDALVEDFARHFVERVSNGAPEDEMGAIMQGGLGEEAAGRIQAPPKMAGPADPWPSVKAADPKRIALVLAGEQAAVIAAALRAFAPPQAAQIIALLPGAKQAAVTRTLLAMRDPAAGALRVIGDAILSSLSAEDPDVKSAAGRKRVAAILNGLGRAGARDILTAVAERSEADARAIEAMLFDFDDVSTLAPASRVILFDALPVDQIAAALTGAPDSLRDCVLSALSARTRRMAEAELAAPQPRPNEAVMQARRLIADAALTLAEAGRISLAKGESDV